jgi:glucose-6-phosphate-specific signal transduction histidine kinase
MIQWQGLPDRVRAGIRFALATIAIGPATFTLVGWAASGFRLSLGEAVWSTSETAVHFVVYALLFFAAIAWARSRKPLPLSVRGLGYLALSIIATALAVLTCYITGVDPDDPWYMFRKTIVFGLVLTPILLLIEGIWDRLGQTRREVERRALGEERARRAAAEARWSSLESRLHPHFVFNTLASIRELMHQDTPRADLMIQRFAELLRFSLDAPRNPLIPLEEELRMVTGYLEIEQMRLGRRLAWTVDAEPKSVSARIPSLSVLTLVENAIKHAVSARRVGGRVSVVAGFYGDSLRLEVTDDGPGFTGDNLPAGHGLDLLRERLLMMYGGGATLRVLARHPGTSVEILLPVLVEELKPNA